VKVIYAGVEVSRKKGKKKLSVICVEVRDQYQDYCKLYTDRSMSGDQVGSATICGTTTKTVRLPNGVSIFRAELYAID